MPKPIIENEVVPPTMRAVAVENGTGPASALHVAVVDRPEARVGEILIRVRAAGINRPDIQQRLGRYPPPPGVSNIIGLEIAGEVVTPAGRWGVGDRVCALLAGGGYAEYAVCDARHALPIPDGLRFDEVAALPETVFTVYANVFELGGLKAGETLLVHGATSGIGVTAIQMAKAAGARVIATARGADKADAAIGLGADIAIDTSAEDFAERVKHEGGADVVLDMVGADYFSQNLDALKSGGRIVFIAALSGADVTLPVFRLMQKRAIVTGSAMRPRSADEKARLAGEIERIVWPWVATGKIAPPIDRVFPFDEVAAAHAHLETGGHVGKLVLHIA